MDRLEIKRYILRYFHIMSIKRKNMDKLQSKAHTIRSAQVRWMRRSIILFLLCSLNLSLRRWTRE